MMAIPMNVPSANAFHRKQIGKTIRDRSGKLEGKVVGVSYRYCAACQRNAICYQVDLTNGKRILPCAKEVRPDGDKLLMYV